MKRPLLAEVTCEDFKSPENTVQQFSMYLRSLPFTNIFLVGSSWEHCFNNDNTTLSSSQHLATMQYILSCKNQKN